MKPQSAHKLHGILLMALFALSAFYIADLPIFKKLSISPLIVGIIMGMFYANTLRMHLPKEWTPGILFCSKTLLRGAIIFYGFRLTFQHVVAVGLSAVIIDIIVVSSVILLGLILGKVFRMDKNTTILTSAGSAICGAAAVLGTEAVLPGAKPHQTAVSVSTVVIFGTLSMFLYPALYRIGILGLNPQEMGVYTGATLHEVAHVVGAGNAMGDAVIADTSVIVKMTRVMLLVPFLLILSYFSNKKRGNENDKKTKIVIPWFAFGFLAVIALNSLNFLPTRAVDTINTLDNFALTMAMTALGAESNFSKFKQSGAKPFILAFCLFLWLFFGGFFLTKILV